MPLGFRRPSEVADVPKGRGGDEDDGDGGEDGGHLNRCDAQISTGLNTPSLLFGGRQIDSQLHEPGEVTEQDGRGCTK